MMEENRGNGNGGGGEMERRNYVDQDKFRLKVGIQAGLGDGDCCDVKRLLTTVPNNKGSRVVSSLQGNMLMRSNGD